MSRQSAPLASPEASRSEAARPDAIPAWQRTLRRAERLIEQKQHVRAAALLERVFAIETIEYEGALWIARLYREMMHWPAALAAAERAIALAPNRLPAYEILMGIALEAGDRPRAVAASQALIKIAPRHIPAHSALGAVYIQMGDMEAAMRVTNTLIRLDPETAAHHFKKALLCQHQGEVALAVYEFTQTMRLDRDGSYAEAAREALETLDAYQINQIFTLAMEDAVFRAKLLRDPAEAALERGFALSDAGCQLLAELSSNALPEIPAPCRPILYN
jgi:tetratricopeptide (TPR) repeat protein